MEDDIIKTDEGGDEQGKAWLTSVPEELRGHEVFKTIDKPAEVYQRLIDLTEKSKDMVVIPKENATPEETAAYRKALGIPESPEGYELEEINLPEGMARDELLRKKFLDTAHQLHFTPAQVSGLYKMYQDYQIGFHNATLKSIDENREKAVNTLKNMWKGDSYQEKINKTVDTFRTSLKHLSPPETIGGLEGVKEWFETNGLGDDPVLIWYLSEVFNYMGDDRLIKGTPAGGSKTEPGMLDFSKSMK